MIGAASLLAGTALSDPASSRPGWRMMPPHIAFDVAKRLRDKVASRYDEAIGFSMPGRDGLMMGPDQSNIYDDTAVVAAPEFASRIQAGIMPNFSRWASFIAGIAEMSDDERDDLALALERVDEFLFEMVNSSNFVIEANEALLDLGIGTGALCIDDSRMVNPLNSRAVPLRNLYFGIGPDGAPDPIFEQRRMNYQDILFEYPEARMPVGWANGADGEWCELDVVECWQRDWSDPEANRYRRTAFLPQHQNWQLVEEEYKGPGACRYIVFRWSKASGEGWGRGPLFNTLPSMRVVNFAMSAVLDHSDMALAGIWTIDDDGVVNPDTVKLEPGTLVPKAQGSDGLRNVALGGNFDVQQFLVEEHRKNIRRALYTEQLGDPNRSPKTATEIDQRMAELARAIGSAFGRLVIELVMPSIFRMLRILKDRGLIKMPTVNGKEIKLIATSPLAQAQNYQDIDAVDKFTGLVQARFGTDGLNVFVDGSETTSYLADRFKVPRRILRPKAEQTKLIQQFAQQAGAGGTGEPAGQQPAPGGGGAPA